MWFRRSVRRQAGFAVLVLIFTTCFGAPFLAAERTIPLIEEQHPPSASDWGGVGLLQTRTARFGRDGQFDVGMSFVDPYRRYYLNLLAVPWLEATFRYTDIENIFITGDPSFSGDQTFKDRGADLKLKVLNESKYAPALAIGVQDGLGTGLFSSEYVVVSKRFYDLDFSLGIAWGNLGSAGHIKNPLIYLSETFRNRARDTGFGGRFNLGTYFSGERAAIFGGVEYRTPLKGLSLKVEYDSNNYQSEPLFGDPDFPPITPFTPQTTPFNFGANYRPFPWIEVSGGYERGNTWMFRFSVRYNFNDRGMPKFLDPSPPKVVPRAQEQYGTNEPVARESDPKATTTIGGQQAKAVTLVENLYAELEHHNLEVIEIGFTHREVRALVSSIPGHHATLLAASAIVKAVPTPVEKVTFISQSGDRRGDQVTLGREEIKREKAVDVLFGSLEAEGFLIETLELTQRQATIFVSAPEFKTNQDFVMMSRRLLASEVSEYADEITLVGVNESFDSIRIAVTTSNSMLHQVPDIVEENGTNVQRHESLSPETAKRIFEELKDQGLQVDAIAVSKRRATVYVTPRKYREIARSVGRAARVVANNVPESVEEISVILVVSGLETGRVTILRRDLEKAVASEGSSDEIWARAQVGSKSEDMSQTRIPNPDRYPSLRLHFAPRLTQYIGDASRFYLYGIHAALSGNFDIAPGLSLSGVAGRDIYNNFDRIRIVSDSILPRVRSNVRFYLQERNVFIERLQADYLFSPITDVFMRFSAGIFEQMFGGYSTEVLIRPYGKRLAVGADINWVRQREFQQLFGFQEYAVTTGHLNIYYDMPFHNLLGSVHIGSYLARDEGATFRLSRLFDSGVRAGVWASLTDVSAEDFGEGSFDKGFFITIPFQLFLPKSALRTGTVSFRPLTRDGGQMVLVGKRLYDVTATGNLNYITRDWDEFLN